jgi:hypothetical protein
LQCSCPRSRFGCLLARASRGSLAMSRQADYCVYHFHFLPPLWPWDQTFRCTTYSYDFLATEIYQPQDGNTPTSCFEWVVKIGTGVTCTILSVDEYKILLCAVHGPKLQWPNCTRERQRWE